MARLRNRWKAVLDLDRYTNLLVEGHGLSPFQSQSCIAFPTSTNPQKCSLVHKSLTISQKYDKYHAAPLLPVVVTHRLSWSDHTRVRQLGMHWLAMITRRAEVWHASPVFFISDRQSHYWIVPVFIESAGSKSEHENFILTVILNYFLWSEYLNSLKLFIDILIKGWSKIDVNFHQICTGSTSTIIQDAQVGHQSHLMLNKSCFF